MKTDVLFIMGMGGPDSLEAIEPFLYNLFCDRDIIDFHIGNALQKFVAKKISTSRSKKIAPMYLEMGFGGASPQNHYNRLIFKKLESEYKKVTGKDLKVIEANCYYHPFFEEAYEELKNTDYDKVIFTTVYPQYSLTTVEACFNRLGKIHNIPGYMSEKNIVIPHWFRNEAYSRAIANRIIEAARSINKPVKECYILYSAHSVPISFVERGDIYPSHIAEHVDIINKMLGIKDYTISYQSKVGPVKWLSPSTQSKMDEISKNSIDNIIIVPISFITDHIETLIEIDKELIPIVKKVGKTVVRIKGLNDSDDFVSALCSVITSATTIIKN